MSACTKRWRTVCGDRPPEAASGVSSLSSSPDPFPWLAATLAVWLLLPGAAGSAPAPASTQAARRPTISAEVFANKALEHFYSLEYDQAITLYQKALELEPENPRYWTALADCYLFKLLQAAGRLHSNLYTASNDFLHARPVEPDPALVKAMWEALGRARSICQERLRQNPRDADAHYALGLSDAVEANYNLNVARRYREALRAGTRAKEHHERARQYDPSNHDANLLIGLHEYAVGSLPGAVRWLTYLAGYTGSKERGVELMHDALLHGRHSSPAALALLALVYTREKQHAYSREMLQHLLRFFPRNFLFQMEIGRSFERENSLDAAIETYRDVGRKMEKRAPGFDRVDESRLYFQIAALLDRQRNGGEALSYYQKVARLKESEGMLRAHSYLRMGEIHQSAGRTGEAREMYEAARQMPFADVQRQASARLRTLSD